MGESVRNDLLSVQSFLGELPHEDNTFEWTISKIMFYRRSCFTVGLFIEHRNDFKTYFIFETIVMVQNILKQFIIIHLVRKWLILKHESSSPCSENLPLNSIFVKLLEFIHELLPVNIILESTSLVSSVIKIWKFCLKCISLWFMFNKTKYE
jgi:hypothetical protein